MDEIVQLQPALEIVGCPVLSLPRLKDRAIEASLTKPVNLPISANSMNHFLYLWVQLPSAVILPWDRVHVIRSGARRMLDDGLVNSVICSNHMQSICTRSVSWKLMRRVYVF